MAPLPFTEPTDGPHLALARSAATEAITDNPRATDWFGVACAITDASIRDLQSTAINREG